MLQFAAGTNDVARTLAECTAKGAITIIGGGTCLFLCMGMWLCNWACVAVFCSACCSVYSVCCSVCMIQGGEDS